MKITKRQLRRIIKEAIEGNVHGDPEKEAYLDIAVAAISQAQYKRAASAIMDSYSIDDAWPEEEQALIDMLSQNTEEDVEVLADEWYEARRAGTWDGPEFDDNDGQEGPPPEEDMAYATGRPWEHN